jgi:hypothetical protein
MKLCVCRGDGVCSIDPDKPTPDQVLRHYSCVLADIYVNKTAGHFTFSGVLAEFNMMMAKV